MSSTILKIAVGGAALLAAPALIAGGGFTVAIAVAVAWIVGVFGTREGLEIYRRRNVGAKAGQRPDWNTRITQSTDDEDRWGRS